MTEQRELFELILNEMDFNGKGWLKVKIGKFLTKLEPTPTSNIFIDLGFDDEAAILKSESDEIIAERKANNITVIVAGGTATGKSTISCLIGNFLKRNGFDTDIQLLDGLDPEEFEVGIVQKKLAVQNKRTTITVTEKQLSRSQFEVIG